MSARIFRYVRHHEAQDYVLMGWIPRPEILFGTPHGDYSIVMENICPMQCPLSHSMLAKSHSEQVNSLTATERNSTETNFKIIKT